MQRLAHIFSVFLYPLCGEFFIFIGGGTFCEKMCACVADYKNKSIMFVPKWSGSH